MTTVTQQRLRGRPAHTPGLTYLAYTPNGRRLITAGSNNAIRIYTTGSDGEPVNVDDSQESNTAIVATNAFFITGSEDGTVCLYSLETNSLDKVLIRCTLPVRDVALSPDGLWAAVASDELVIKMVNTQDMREVKYIRDLPKPAKHLSFHPNGIYLAASGSDGVVYVYDVTKDEPELVQKVDGLIRSLDTDIEISSRVVWHPDGRAFAAPTSTRDIQVMSRSDWAWQRAFATGHMGDITAVAWSPNGALLASAGNDRKVLLWETKTQTIVARYDYPKVMSLAWHPSENILSFTNTDGELFIFPGFVPTERASLLEKSLQPAPFIHDPQEDGSARPRPPTIHGDKVVGRPRPRRGTPDSIDDILGPDLMNEDDEDDDGFVSDDDGAGYTNGINGNGKRTTGDLDDLDHAGGKRRATYGAWQPQIHHPFQPGSLNLIGAVWTVDQDEHYTVTVEFYDRGLYRDFHFRDDHAFDMACLTEHGTMFANSEDGEVHYRPHETWSTRADWATAIPSGERIVAISLSDSFAVVSTSTNYVRTFTLFGVPFRVYRQKNSPTVTCASWRDYVLTMGNGPVGADGSTQLTYTIENVKRDEVCQSEDLVALPPGGKLRSVFFSDNGDPCVYDSTGVLLILLHWRTPGQARWMPILDTTKLDRLVDGRKTESYWPVAVAQEKFHCIILKGGDTSPYFPRPLLSEFGFKIPLHGPQQAASNADPDATVQNQTTPRAGLEGAYALQSLSHALQSDTALTSTITQTQQRELTRREVEIDKILLQMLATECREGGDEHGMKALEIVRLMRDASGKMLEAAEKVADRFGCVLLQAKIREVAERRLLGDVNGEGEGGEGMDDEYEYD
ncbi:MAG: hypothetical protein M1838_000040 [Thelocarpon superellum]|nr:MAG: hypothetical protein M1838_000040 [Thelocarpon superellum]